MFQDLLDYFVFQLCKPHNSWPFEAYIIAGAAFSVVVVVTKLVPFVLSLDTLPAKTDMLLILRAIICGWHRRSGSLIRRVAHLPALSRILRCARILCIPGRWKVE